MSELKHYKCHKEVDAKPMTLGEYQEASGRQLMGDPATEGYLVVYSKGTEQEYHSWSPKEVFESGYTEI